MTIRSALAAVAVADLGEAKDFYARLFGRGPDVEPMPTLAQWDLDAGGVQVVEHAGNAGSSMVTLVVDGFDDLVATLADAGFEPGDVVDGTLSRLVQITDPAGNVVTLVEDPGAA